MPQHQALGKQVPVEYSARHVHLSLEDQNVLFSKEHNMTQMKELSQTGQWAAEEKVTIRGPKGEVQARVLGPCRKQTQVELAWSDGRELGIDTPVRVSGDLAGSGGGVTLVGPAGSIELKEGVINDERHLHCSTAEANILGLKNGDVVDVSIPGETPFVALGVVVRVHPTFRLAVHLDTDEANAASLGEQRRNGEIVGVHPMMNKPEHFFGDI